MAIGDSISQPIPAVGTSGTGYASQLVAFLTEVKARLEAKVALTSLLAGLFDLSNNPIANAKYLGLYEQLAAPTTPVGSLARYGGNLYWVSPSGAVRITNGATLDAVSLRGITGSYAAPAEFYYDLGSITYQAFSDTGTTPDTWAHMAARDFDVYGTATSTTRVRIAWGGGASYTLTLPAAVPGTQQLIQMTAAGALLATNTIAENITLASGKNLTLQGAGTVKHSTHTLICHGSAFTTAGTVTNGVLGGTFSSYILSTGCTAYIRLDGLKEGDRITRIKVYHSGAISGSANLTVELRRIVGTTGVATDEGSGSSTVSPVNSAVLARDVAGFNLWVKLTTTTSDYAIYYIAVEYERP